MPVYQEYIDANMHKGKNLSVINRAFSIALSFSPLGNSVFRMKLNM